MDPNHNHELQFHSFFESGSIDGIQKEIQDTYLLNNYPWVIGFSGGKDSTATVQLIWNALAKLPIGKLTKPVYIISSDTLVETPVVVNQINDNLKKMEESAKNLGLPFFIQKVTPKIEDSFWVNLIGKGYPAPSQQFRWCTERLKIKPVNAFILETAAAFGEVVMVLGARKSESMSRAQVLNKREKQPGTQLTRHSSLSRAYVYTPIEDFTTDDVWTYLLQVPSPWGGSNRDLAALYRSTQSGECPLVVDTSSPSCGNSRFGCWVCTLVVKDKSMQGLIDNGEEWLEPLLDYRDLLAETQKPERKSEFREFKRRNGQVFVKDGKTIPGPYKFEFRKSLLLKLLMMQKNLQKDGPDPDLLLITSAELHEIRKIWKAELADWEDSVPKIYQEVFNSNMNWVNDETPRFTSDDKELLQTICSDNNLPLQLMTRLLDVESQMNGIGRRVGIYQKFHNIFSEEWRAEGEIISDSKIQNEVQRELGLNLNEN
jgi:DNA sulfur modification protein DndC